ncbi:SEA domain [Trinorchestia longiramus]|nr:SEA domain [Trinorchestia longiramus]
MKARQARPVHASVMRCVLQSDDAARITSADVKSPLEAILGTGNSDETEEARQRLKNEMVQSDFSTTLPSFYSEVVMDDSPASLNEDRDEEEGLTSNSKSDNSWVNTDAKIGFHLISNSRLTSGDTKRSSKLVRHSRSSSSSQNLNSSISSSPSSFFNIFFIREDIVSPTTEATETTTNRPTTPTLSTKTESVLSLLFGDATDNTISLSTSNSVPDSGTSLNSVLFGRSIAEKSTPSESSVRAEVSQSENEYTRHPNQRQSRAVDEPVVNLDLITEENHSINDISETSVPDTTDDFYQDKSFQTHLDYESSTKIIGVVSGAQSSVTSAEEESSSVTETEESIDLYNSTPDPLKTSNNIVSDKNSVIKQKFPRLSAPILSSSAVEILTLSRAEDEKKSGSTESLNVKSVTFINHQMTSRIVETSLFSSSTVSPILVAKQGQETSVRRIQRSIDYDVSPSENVDGSHVTAFVGVEGRSANQLKKNSRRSDPEPDIDDIIQGIMHLLGGNVKIDADSSVQTHLTTFGGAQPVSSTRTNDRGPPRLPLNPFNFFNSRPTRTRPPVRRPISQSLHGVPSRGRPSFVANTLPPFIATLPPQLDTPRLQGSPGSPTLTAYPIPVNLLPESSENSVTSPKVQFPSSTSAVHSVTVGELFELEQHEETTYVNDIQEVTPALPLSSSESDGYLVLAETTTPILIENDTEKPTDTDLSTTPVYSVELESSLNIKNIPSSVESVYSSPLPPDLVSKIRNAPSTTELTSSTDFESIIGAQNFKSVLTVSNSLVSTIVSSVSSTVILEESSLSDLNSIHSSSGSNHHESRRPSKRPEASESISKTKTHAGFSRTKFNNRLPGIPSSTKIHQHRPGIPTATRVFKPRPGVPIATQVRPLRPGIATTTRVLQPRPGVVLDAEYHPGHVVTSPLRRPTNLLGQVFDVTVSAQQGFGGQVSPVRPPHLPSYAPQRPYDYQGPVRGVESLLVTPTEGEDGFVSIDGRKTYFDLFPTATAQALPQQTVGLGIGMVIPEEELIDGEFPDLGPSYNVPAVASNINNRRPGPLPPVRPQISPLPGTYYTSAPAAPLTSSGTPLPFKRRPSTPSIRIDTCIVGDDSTCQEQLQEVCRTEGDVSSCYCKPGTDRRRPRTMCKKMVMLEISVKVNRVGNQRVSWSGNYANPESEEYQLLEWEAQKAIESAFKKSAMKSIYLGNKVEKFYTLGGNVIVNSTVKLEDNPSTRSQDIKRSLQRHLIKVIQAHNNNIGNSALWVDGPLNPIPVVDDVNECSSGSLNDCHEHATCINEFATFGCRCLPGYTDRYRSDPERMGRHCESCSADHCHKRGECKIADGKKVCQCKGSYYGDRCEVDGEVVAVAVGASAAAVIIILMTLLFLCMWSRRWKIQDQKSETLRRGGFLARAAAGGHYLQQKFAMVGQPQPQQFGPTMEDHIRWAQMSEAAMAAQQGLYGTLPAQTAPFYAAGNHGFSNRSNFPSRPYRNYPESVYSRVSRTLSNPMTFRNKFVARLRSFFSRGSKSEVAKPCTGDLSAFIVSPNPNTMSMQQMMALRAHLAASNQNQDHLMGSGPLASSAPAPMFKNHRQMGGASEYGQLCPPTQFGGSQFGLQHLNPTMLPMVGPSSMTHQNFSRTPSTYGQYPGPASLSMSQSGASRTTVQLCGQGSSGLETSSEEEEPRRGDRSGGPGSCYQIPRPKSRASVGDSSDLYYELDDMTAPAPNSGDFTHFNNILSNGPNAQENFFVAHRQSLRQMPHPPYPNKPPPPLPRQIFSSN